jgi:hypothetical protein
MVIADSQNQSRFNTLPALNDRIAKGGKKNG